MDHLKPDDIDGMTPFRRRGNMVHIPNWAWRIHTITMVFLMTIVLAGIVLFGIDYMYTRKIANELEKDRDKDKMAAAAALLHHEQRLTNLENDRADELRTMKELRDTVSTMAQDIAVIKARMTP